VAWIGRNPVGFEFAKTITNQPMSSWAALPDGRGTAFPGCVLASYEFAIALAGE
jgi:hypothetical protein